MRIRKPGKSEIILALLLFLIILLPIILLPKNKHSVNKVIPMSGYASHIVQDVTSGKDYEDADIDEKIRMFYDFLVLISENGYDMTPEEGYEYYDLIIYPDEIVIDWDNKIISFCEHYDGTDDVKTMTFEYRFNEEILIDLEARSRIEDLIEDGLFDPSDAP